MRKGTLFFPEGLPSEEYILDSRYMSRVALAIFRVGVLMYVCATTMAFYYVRRRGEHSLYEYFQYFTHWSWLILVGYYCTLYFCYVYWWGSGRIPTPLRVLAHVLLDTIAPLAPLIVAGGWIGMVPGIRDYGAVFFVYSLNEHGVNMFLCLFEVAMVRHRFHYTHVAFSLLYGMCYIAYYVVRCGVTGKHAYEELTCDRAGSGFVGSVFMMAATFGVLRWMTGFADAQFASDAAKGYSANAAIFREMEISREYERAVVGSRSG